MKRRIDKLITGVVILMIVMPLYSGCQEEKPADPELQVIYEDCKELFTRIKVRDFEGIWEYEYPYIHEERSLESFLGDYRIVRYKPDTLLAIEIDSIIMRGKDSALCYMKLEWVLADSSLSTQEIALAWFKVDDNWLKPTMSREGKQRAFEEEMRVYWEAVRAMEEKEEAEEAEEEDSQGEASGD